MQTNSNKISDKLNKVVQYLCEDCDTEFCLLDNDIVCPSCASREITHMVVIYKEDDPELNAMYTKIHWVAGD